jgi:putative sigma-54 modulation protein
MIRITVSGRHMDVGDALKSYATEKVEKLERFYDRVHNVEVVFDELRRQGRARGPLRSPGCLR